MLAAVTLGLVGCDSTTNKDKAKEKVGEVVEAAKEKLQNKADEVKAAMEAKKGQAKEEAGTTTP